MVMKEVRGNRCEKPHFLEKREKWRTLVRLVDREAWRTRGTSAPGGDGDLAGRRAGGYVSVTCVSEFTVKVVAFTPPNFTVVVCFNPVPVITTGVPTGPAGQAFSPRDTLMPSSEAYPRALAAAKKAVELDGHEGQGGVGLGILIPVTDETLEVSPYSTAMNFRHTGEGTWSVWPVVVSRPELGSIRKTTMLPVS